MTGYALLGDVKAVAAGLRRFRAFLASEATHIKTADWTAPYADKPTTQRRMTALIHASINIRGGEAWRSSNEGEIEMIRDAHRVRSKVVCRIRFYQLETRWAKKRFGHLIDDPND